MRTINSKKNIQKLKGYTISTKRRLSSVEMTFKREDIIDKGIRMNENFGLGSTFPSAEEQLFKLSMLKAKLKVAFVAQPIVRHFGKTTGYNQAEPGYMRALTAQKFLSYGYWTYIWLIKFVFFLYRHRHVLFLSNLEHLKLGLKL